MSQGHRKSKEKLGLNIRSLNSPFKYQSYLSKVGAYFSNFFPCCDYS